MATILVNQADITYNFGLSSSGAATSNQTETEVINPYAIEINKYSLSPNYRPGGTIAYLIQVLNTGTQPVDNIVIYDNLGSTGSSDPLTYVENSAVVIISGVEYDVEPMIVSGNLVFNLPVTLSPGAEIIVGYSVIVAAGTTGCITNTATVVAEGTTPIQVTDNASAVVEEEAFASICLFKSAPDSVELNSALNYTLTLTNNGNTTATNVSVTDILPQGFSITGISVSINGAAPFFYTAADWTLIGNTLTFPNLGSEQITVPPMGKTEIIISGTVVSV